MKNFLPAIFAKKTLLGGFLKTISGLFLATLVLVGQSQTVEFTRLNPIDIPAKGYVLMDANTGLILEKHNHDLRLEPASITKLMTAYLVYQALDKKQLFLTDYLQTSRKARAMEGSRMFLEYGAKTEVGNLLKGLVIQSGNDAAIVLAEGVAQSESEFVKQMNVTAKALNLNQTHFTNVTGLPNTNHYSTAWDIAKLSRRLILDYPSYYATYREKSFTYNKITQDNRNGLLFRDPSVDGLKTGHTESAGYCLAASAQRDDFRLIAVVLGATSVRNREAATQQILDYGFAHYQPKTVYAAGQEIDKQQINQATKQVSVVSPKDIVLPIYIDNPDVMVANLEFDQALQAPIKKGTIMGNLVIKFNDMQIAYPVVAGEDIERIGWFKRAWNALVTWISAWFD